MLIKLKEYEMYLRENEIAKNTIKNYLNTLQQLQDYLVVKGVKADETVEKVDLIEFKTYLEETFYSPGQKYELSSMNQKIVCINIYFNWVFNGKEHDMKLKTHRVQTKAHRESIDEKEYKRMLKYSSGEVHYFMLLIANTGLRISEACQVRKSDLSIAEIKITNKGKSRVIGIPVWLKKQLLAWSQVKQLKDGDFIFNKTQQYYRGALKITAGKAKVNLNKVYPHSFRHFFAKMFIKNGGDSTVLQQMLGHSDIATTTIYTHLNQSELARTFSTVRNI